ncbi:unnamed protein product [Adineta ricciae]|uniref:Uncharacterized protein n=2 Tax=Adineta ricciae TaxID=249248 RepID=A0A815VHE0_ADIRI|nr:unnamed protein product [Adineta ricciae]
MASNNHHQIGIDANGLKMDKVVFKFDNYEKKVFDLQIKGSFAPGVSNGVIKLFGSDDGVAQSFIANNNNNNNNSNHEVVLSITPIWFVNDFVAQTEANGDNDQQISELNMCQLSTKVTNNEVYLIKDIKAEIQKIPNFLTKHNTSFQQLLQQAQSLLQSTTTTTGNKVESLRKVALVIYKIMIIQTCHLLWTTYLQSGQGQLLIPSDLTKVSVWPKELKIL